MSDIVRVESKVRSFEAGPQAEGYTRVILNVSDDLFYSAGTDTGKTLTLHNPWGTQAMADNILNRMQGYKYQPYKAAGAVTDPAAELGDGIYIGDTYGGIYAMETRLGRLVTADLHSPWEEDLDEETPYKSRTDREIARVRSETKSEFKIQADSIEAKVSKTGGDSTTFGWELTADGFVLASGGRNVFRADEDGITVTGRIVATEGYIGNGSSGFTIADRAIYNGVTSMQDAAHYGVYVGVDGIALGKGAFRVDSQGNLTASSGTFSGYVKAGRIQYGGENGTLSGSALTAQSIYGGSGGAIRGSTLSTFNLTGGVNTSLGYADYSNMAFNGIQQVPNLLASQSRITRLQIADRLTIGTDRVGKATISYKNSADEIKTINVLTW